MKKILFFWAALFCFGMTAYGVPAVKSENGNVLSDGIHWYAGTITMTALDGTMTVYTGRKLKAEVRGDQISYTLLKLPLAVASITVTIPDITVDLATGDIPQQENIGVVALNVVLAGNVYGNIQTDQSCDFIFDVEASKGFVRFEFTGTATN